MVDDASDQPDWPVSFDDHRRAQMRWIAEHTTPAQRLAWLEQMIEIARHVGERPPGGA